MNDQKNTSGNTLSFECCFLLQKLMELNPADETIQRKFQETINILFEKFSVSMPKPL